MTMTRDIETALATVWDALGAYREDLIPEGDESYDSEWESICEAMADIREELGLPSEVEVENMTDEARAAYLDEVKPWDVGTISEGTTVPRDIAAAILAHFEEGTFQEATLAALRAIADSDFVAPETWAATLDDVEHELTMSDRFPAFCYVGTHWGDGADFGIWPQLDVVEESVSEGEVLKVSDLSEVPDGFADYVLHVNDHGNATLYIARPDGSFREVWGVV